MQLDILSEFLGTLVLILLGNGVGASVSYNKMFANQSGKWIVITMAWGFAVLFGVLVSLSLGGSAHLNPAVTVFVGVSDSSFPIWKIFVYILVQVLGAMTAQIVLNFINWKHMQISEFAVVRGTHCTNPAFANFGKDRAVVQNMSYELVGTLVLVGLILAFGRGGNDGRLVSLGPIPVAFLVMAIGMSLGSSTGYAINPARDFGPRIVYYVTEKILKRTNETQVVGANFGYSWVPVVMPLIGGAIIGGLALI